MSHSKNEAVVTTTPLCVNRCHTHVRKQRSHKSLDFLQQLVIHEASHYTTTGSCSSTLWTNNRSAGGSCLVPFSTCHGAQEDWMLMESVEFNTPAVLLHFMLQSWNKTFNTFTNLHINKYL